MKDDKKSDSFIVAKKVVMTLERRDEHKYCFFSKTFYTLEVSRKWQMNKKI
jgi:hypothetical protein